MISRDRNGRFVKGHKPTPYKHKPQQGFRKGNNFGIQNKGRKRTKIWLERQRNSRLGKHYSKRTEFKKGNLSWTKGKRCPWAVNNPQTFKPRKKHPNWLGGKSIVYPTVFNRSLKKEIKEHYKYKCQICKKYSKIRMAVHHIDYNKNNCRRSNLIALCQKCHSQTNHNRNYWLNYFKNHEYKNR